MLIIFIFFIEFMFYVVVLLQFYIVQKLEGILAIAIVVTKKIKVVATLLFTGLKHPILTFFFNFVLISIVALIII